MTMNGRKREGLRSALCLLAGLVVAAARSLQGAAPLDNMPPCVPILDKTAIIIGEDFDSIHNYTTAFPLNSHPFGVMSYTALKNEHGELPGVVEKIDYGSGTQWAEGLVEAFPSSSIQLGVWLVGQLDAVVSGELDGAIDALAAFLNRSRPTAFYLRLGYEFDSAENDYNPQTYQQAFQYIVKKIRAMGVTNAHFVWHASGFKPRGDMVVAEWFPGEGVVDWCGVSLFQQPYECSGGGMCSMEYADALAEFCRDKGVPLMIAESAPFGGIVDDVDAQADPQLTNEAGYKGSTWTRWFLPVFRFIQSHDVRIWCYINTDWDAQPMWALRHEKGVEWGDTRLQGHKDVMDKWRKTVLSSRRSVNSYSFRDNVCENYPSSNSTHKGFLDPISGLFSGNKTAYHHRGDSPTFEEELEIEAKDVLLVILKFTEVLILLMFSLVVMLIVVAAAYKIVHRYYEKEGYTTIH